MGRLGLIPGQGQAPVSTADHRDHSAGSVTCTPPAALSPAQVPASAPSARGTDEGTEDGALVDVFGIPGPCG